MNRPLLELWLKESKEGYVSKTIIQDFPRLIKAVLMLEETMRDIEEGTQCGWTETRIHVALIKLEEM